MRTPPLLADFTHTRVCKPFCEKYLTLTWFVVSFQNGVLRLHSARGLQTMSFYFNLIRLPVHHIGIERFVPALNDPRRQLLGGGVEQGKVEVFCGVAGGVEHSVGRRVAQARILKEHHRAHLLPVEGFFICAQIPVGVLQPQPSGQAVAQIGVCAGAVDGQRVALPAQALEVEHPQLLVAAFQLIGQRGGAVFAVVLGVEGREDDVAGQLVGPSEPRRCLQHRRHARGVVVGASHQQRSTLARAVEVGAQQNRLGAVPAGQVGDRVLRRAQLIDGVGQPQTNLIARLVELRIDLLGDQDAAGGARSIGVVGAVGDVAACQAEPAGRAFQVKLGVPDALALVAEGVVGGEGKGGVHRLRRGPEGPVHAQLERRSRCRPGRPATPSRAAPR